MRKKSIYTTIIIVLSIVCCSCVSKSEAQLYADGFIEAVFSGDPLIMDDYVQVNNADVLYWTPIMGSEMDYTTEDVSIDEHVNDMSAIKYEIGVPQKGYAVTGNLLISKNEVVEDDYTINNLDDFYNDIIACGIMYDFCNKPLYSGDVNDSTVEAYVCGIIDRMISSESMDHYHTRLYSIPSPDVTYKVNRITYLGEEGEERIKTLVTLSDKYGSKDIIIELAQLEFFDGNYGVINANDFLKEILQFRVSSGVAAIDAQ